MSSNNIALRVENIHECVLAHWRILGEMAALLGLESVGFSALFNPGLISQIEAAFGLRVASGSTISDPVRVTKLSGLC
jgi:hypothetical protein